LLRLLRVGVVYGMLPRVILRVKRALRRLTPRPEELGSTGPETEASWERMLSRHKRPDFDTERRLKVVERELNRLGLD
jgi:hypothetical protein